MLAILIDLFSCVQQQIHRNALHIDLRLLENQLIQNIP
jgi:hypothetical protein